MAGNEYDAIVMDLRLPDKHGLVVLREMRNRDDRTPVLLLTAQGALQDRVRGLNLGADDFLTKPFALEELEARLTALVRRSLVASIPDCNAVRCPTTAKAAPSRWTAPCCS